MKCANWTLLLHMVMAALPLAVVVAAPAQAGCTTLLDLDGEVKLRLRLADDEQSAQCRRSLDAPILSWYRSISDSNVWLEGEDITLDVHGSGIVEVEIRTEASGGHFDFVGLQRIVIGDGAFAGFTDSFADVTSDPDPETYSFFLQHNKQRFDAQLQLLLAGNDDTEAQQQQLLDDAWGNRELVMTVRRVSQACWMKAWVTGDVEVPRIYHGDVAWFRTADEPVKEGMMVGTMADTDLAESFSTVTTASPEAALDLAASLGLISAEEREEAAADLPQQASQSAQSNGSFSQWLREETRAGEGEDGDNFGLNLAAIDLDANPGSDAGAAAMLSSAFTLALSGRVMDYAPDEQAQSAEIDFQTSLVQATVGLGDQGGNRIPFGLGELEGWFTTTGNDDDFIVGFLAGELESESKYSLGGMVAHGSGAVAASAPRILKIGVLAKFAARRGAFSCTGP